MRLPTNLALVNDLYYFWTSTRYGPYANDDRIAARRGLAAAARDIYSDPRALIGALRADDESFLWSVRALVLPEDQDEPPSDLREFADWAWLSQPLLDGSEIAPDAVLPQLVRVLGDVRTQPRIRPAGMVRDYRLEPARFEALFERRADAILRRIAAVVESTDWALLEAAAQCRERLRQP